MTSNDNWNPFLFVSWPFPVLGIRMHIPDPGSKFFYPGCRIHGRKGTGSRIRNKEVKYFLPKKLSSRKYDPGCLSRISYPNFFHPGSWTRIPGLKSSGSGIRIRNTVFIFLWCLCVGVGARTRVRSIWRLGEQNQESESPCTVLG